MVELVEYIAKSLVDNPDLVSISSEKENDELNIYLKVAQSDMGKIIGKQGRIAKAIRSILKAISLKENIKVNLEIEEIK
ncbi:KH domain-containing protein [Anaerosphaera multitolerans]|uniref:RNA-binding protein KhpA n=1 Tax=Anaerosphaera multitolerans TaxID=2487351 RepID=A0A437S8M6_9FIRM|nr:KH domain-containing protein [Anaerosphaera multitolerans]RVU55291.1 KH domain-containing protein [Anaerosphaera multitolerans]